MKIQRSCCNALIGTEQEQINQLYEIVKALAGNYFEGFELMGTYNENTNYDKKYMLVFYNGGTYVKTVDGDSINFAPDLHPDKWALFTYPAQGERGPKGEGATVAELAEKIEGSETIVIDENEAGTALEVHLDAEVVNKIDRAILTPTSAPQADRIPYIDFISNAVKYANLSGNVQIDGTGALVAQASPTNPYKKTFKFVVEGGEAVILAYAIVPTSERILFETADSLYQSYLMGFTLQGFYVDLSGSEEVVYPTTVQIEKNGSAIRIYNVPGGSNGQTDSFGKDFEYINDPEGSQFSLLNYFELTSVLKMFE